jgi:uncharacterized membrane protein YhhN
VTASAWALLVIAAGFAVGDWAAVIRNDKRLEYVCKPFTMVFLIALASAVEVDDPSVRKWFVLALILSMVGDILLMLPSDRFVFGLAAFLLAHLAYIVGFWVDGVGILNFVIGLAVAGLTAVAIGGRILTAINAGDQRDVLAPVRVYLVVISLMLASAIGTAEAFAVAGAALFYVSDALIAWDRFVRARRWHALTIIVTYHVAQTSLTLSLIT